MKWINLTWVHPKWRNRVWKCGSKPHLLVSSALFVTWRSLTGDTTKPRSSPANSLMRSDHFRGCTHCSFSFSRCVSLPAFIRMKSSWVMNEAVCSPAAVLHYPATVCVIRARARPKLKPCQVAVMKRRVQVRVSKVKVQGSALPDPAHFPSLFISLSSFIVLPFFLHYLSLLL